MPVDDIVCVNVFLKFEMTREKIQFLCTIWCMLLCKQV